MNKNIITIVFGICVLSSSVTASESTWNSHILGSPIPQSKNIKSLDPIGNWAFQLVTKISWQDQDWNGVDKSDDILLDFRPRVFGSYSITEKVRFSADIWMKYKGPFELSGKYTGLHGEWEHLVIGIEHQDFGGIFAGAHATNWGATVMDMHNALGMMDLQGNPKYGSKVFYVNDFGATNDLFVRTMFNPEEDEWGATIGFQNYSAYAAKIPFVTYGIYFDVNNETYMSQSGDSGGGNLHNTDDDPVYTLSGFYGTGKGSYASFYVAYSDDNGVRYEDQPIGFLPTGNPNGQGLSASLMFRHTFQNGIEPLVSFGRGGDGEYAIFDLAYQYNKHVRPYVVSKIASDDETQTVVGVRFDI